MTEWEGVARALAVETANRAVVVSSRDTVVVVVGQLSQHFADDGVVVARAIAGCDRVAGLVGCCLG